MQKQKKKRFKKILEKNYFSFAHNWTQYSFEKHQNSTAVLNNIM